MQKELIVCLMVLIFHLALTKSLPTPLDSDGENDIANEAKFTEQEEERRQIAQILMEMMHESLNDKEEDVVSKRRINRVSAWNKLPPSVMRSMVAGKRMRKLPPSVLFAHN